MAYKWLSFLLFTIVASCLIFHIRFPSVFLNSVFLSLYVFNLFTLVLGFFAKRIIIENKLTKTIGRIGFYGPLAIAIYYASPFYLVLKSIL